MRILVDTVEIGGVIPILANGFRELGHQVKTVIKERHAFFSELQYDVDIPERRLCGPSRFGVETHQLSKFPAGP